jgi:hypothetical protein
MAFRTHIIPPMVHPLGKQWNQPKLEDINMSGDFAVMSKKSFDELHNYTGSMPSGVYEGKMWRTETTDGWYLCWYVDIPDNKCETKVKKIKILE